MKDTLNQNLDQILSLDIPAERREILQVLIDYIKDKRKKEQPIHLHAQLAPFPILPSLGPNRR